MHNKIVHEHKNGERRSLTRELLRTPDTIRYVLKR